MTHVHFPGNLFPRDLSGNNHKTKRDNERQRGLATTFSPIGWNGIALEQKQEVPDSTIPIQSDSPGPGVEGNALLIQ